MASTLGANCQVLLFIADRGAVQHEDVVAVAGAGAVELVAVVDVPAARAARSREAPNCSCVKITPGVSEQQHVALAAVERILLGLLGSKTRPSIGVAGVDDFLLPGDVISTARLADRQLQRKVEALPDRERDCVPLQQLEPRCGDFDVVDTRFKSGIV